MVVDLSLKSDLSGAVEHGNLMWEDFKLLRQRIQDDATSRRLAVGAVAAAGSAATIGYVLWTIRGGFLMATLMASLPAWRSLDLMPILAGGRREEGGVG